MIDWIVFYNWHCVCIYTFFKYKIKTQKNDFQTNPFYHDKGNQSYIKLYTHVHVTVQELHFSNVHVVSFVKTLTIN